MGLGLYNFLSARTYVFLVEDDISVDLFTSLNLAYSYQLSFTERHRIRASTSLPVMAYILGRMRVPNDFPEDVFQSIVEDPTTVPTRELLSSGDLLTFGRFLDVRMRMEYLYDLSQRVGIGFTYLFHYYSYPKFETVTYGSSHYALQLVYKF